MPHLLVAPIVLPLATAALMLLLGEGRRAPRRRQRAVHGCSTWPWR
jgi:hypothetical protein